MRVVFIIAVAFIALSCVNAYPAMMRAKLFKQPQTSWAEFEATGQLRGVDMLDQVKSLVALTEKADPSLNQVTAESTEFLEMATSVSAGTGVQKLENFCEVCILIVQLKHANKPQLCKGLAAEYWLTCVEILESMIRADKALVYWEKNGCLHVGEDGPEIIKPCPALPVCSWIPNLFGAKPSIIRDGVEPLCPKDVKFMPVIPPEYKPVAAGGPGAPSNLNVAGGAPEAAAL